MIIVVAQIIGFIGLIAMIISFQQTKKNNVLVFQILSNLLYFIQYVMLGALSGAVATVIGLVRCIVYYIYDKKEKEKSGLLLSVFLVFNVILGLKVYDDIYSIIPIITAMSYSYSTWQNNLKVFRIIAFFVPICFIVYNFHVSAYVAVISSIIEATAVLVAIIKIDILDKFKHYSKDENYSYN